MQSALTIIKQVGIASTIAVGGGIAALWQASKQTPFQPEDSMGFPSLTIGDNYLATLQTGDLVFFNTPAYVPKPVKWCLSTIKRYANQGEFDHVGVIVYHPTHNYPYVLEYTWLGPIVTSFEDRIGYSESQDVIIRTLHMIRDKSHNQRAQQFLEDELIKSQNSLSIFNRWITNIKSLVGVAYINSISPKASAEVQRFIPLDELHSLLAVAAKPDSPETASQKERLAELQSMTSAREHADSMSHNRVTLFGELLGMLSQLRIIETTVRKHLQQSHNSTQDANQQQELQAPKGGDGLTPQETMLMLQRRNQLYRQFELKYEEYRQRTAELLHSKDLLLNPYQQHSPPAFYDADLVARLFTHLDVLPPSNFDSLQHTQFDNVFPSQLPQFDGHLDEFDLRQYDFSKIHQTLLEHCPHPREYRPHNFRLGAPLALMRGILGEEQYIVQGFNKPPLEYRTGTKAFEEWDTRQ